MTTLSGAWLAGYARPTGSDQERQGSAGASRQPSEPRYAVSHRQRGFEVRFERETRDSALSARARWNASAMVRLSRCGRRESTRTICRRIVSRGVGACASESRSGFYSPSLILEALRALAALLAKTACRARKRSPAQGLLSTLDDSGILSPLGSVPT